jgi:carbonic anhydrase
VPRRWGLTAVIVLAAIGAITAQWRTAWSYDGERGPDRWSALDPEYAACSGRQQSPVDIQGTETADLPPLRFDYTIAPLKYLINNGKTIRVNYHDPKGTGSVLVVGGKRYQLTQFHFHRPSEEYIHGKPFDMVIHLMHEADDGKVAGVAVLVKAGRVNRTVQQLWDHMPSTQGDEHAIAGVDINPADLLPPNAVYYTYEGSLTAPPCTEGVTWFVLKTPVDVSHPQIDAFARLYPHNVRPLQPLNGRVIRESR